MISYFVTNEGLYLTFKGISLYLEDRLDFIENRKCKGIFTQAAKYGNFYVKET